MPETSTGDAAQPQEPDSPKPKAPRRPRASVGDVAPPKALDEKSLANEHKREVALRTLAHDQQMASDAARHKRMMEWAMMGVGVLGCGACIGIGFAPRLSDDLKKIIIGVVALFLSGAFGFKLGQGTSGK